MHLHSYRLCNYRRFHDTLIELAPDISIFVGSNNSGKTSATQAVMMFLSSEKSRFSMFDFSSPTWRRFNHCGDAEPVGQAEPLPSISIDLWFEVTEDDLYLALPILPSSAWSGNLVTETEEPALDLGDEEEDIEYELPAVAENAAPQKR